MAPRGQNRTAKVDEDISDDDNHHHRHKSKLPVIPDLRFEYSYLRSIKSYVHIERVGDGSVSAQQHRRHSSAEELLSDYEKVELSEELAGGDATEHLSAVHNPSTGPKEVVRVQWNKVVWVTTRDQVISPLLQGTLWAIASYFLTPYSASLGSKLGHFMHAKSPTKEGNAAGWLRNWVKSLGLTSKPTEDSRR